MAYEHEHEDIVLNGLNNTIGVRLYIRRHTYSVANNTSTITWSLYLDAKGSLSKLVQLPSPAPSYRVMINGQTWTGVSDINIDANTTKVLQGGSMVITHKPGATATIAYSFTQDCQAPGTASGSGTFTLDAVPGYPTLTAPARFSDEEDPVITYSFNNATKDHVYTLEACIADGTTGTEIYIPYQVIDDTATSYTFEFSASDRTTLRRIAGNNNTLDVRFYLKTTYTNGAETSLVSKPSTMYIDSAAPVLSPTVENVDETTLTLTGDPGTIIRGHNTVRFVSNAVARKGATITSQSTVCGSKRSTSSYGAFSDVESGTFIFTATDNRGNTASATVNLDVIPYVKVSCRQDVVLGNDGVLTLTLSGNYYDGSFGAEDNNLKIEIQQTDPDGNVGDWIDLSALLYETTGNTYTLSYTINGLDPSGTYGFQSRVSDQLTSATSEKQNITWHPVFDWGRNDFNFNVPVYIQGGNCYGAKELYSGSSDGNIVLSDEIDNYNFVDIYFTDNNGRGCGVSRLFGVGGATITLDLSLVEASSATATYIRRTAYICKDRTLSPNKTTAGYVHISGNAVSHTTGTNFIRVIKVLGYR